MTVVNHEAVHTMIAALSALPEGRALVEGIEEIRYYHRAGKIADLGYGARLVVAVDEDEDELYEMGTILLPGRRDRLCYKTADYCEESIPGALYWANSRAEPVVIPRVLGEWGAECILARSGYATLTPAECRGAAYSVDSMPGMEVTAPYDLELPGLTRDKWARRKVQRHYRPDSFSALFVHGYHPHCKVVYNVTASRISNAVCVAEGDFGRWTPEDILDKGNILAYITPDILRGACQVLSDYKHWKYFNTCSALQCARHLVAGDFASNDLSSDEVVPLWERRAAGKQQLAEV